MKRKSSTVPSMVYSFGGLKWLDTESGKYTHRVPEKVFAIFRRGRDYYNTLVGIHLEGRRLYREARERVFPGLVEAEKKVAELKQQRDVLRGFVKDERQSARKRVAVTPEQKEAIENIDKDLKPLYESMTEYRRKAKDSAELQAQSKWLHAEKKRKIREARAVCGIYWGTYLLIERAVDQAAKGKMDPRPRYEPFATVGVQFQKQGADAYGVKDLFNGGNALLQLDRPQKKKKEDGSESRRFAPVKGRIRIESDGRKPVWAEFMVTVHRELPEGGEVKWGWIASERVGSRVESSLQLTVEAAYIPQPSASIGPYVALDVGFRAVQDGAANGLRVGYTFDGREGLQDADREVRLEGARVVDKIRHGESIRPIRDCAFNEHKALLCEWLRSVDSAPEWLTEATKFIHAWHAHGKLARVVLQWRSNRFEGDSAIFSALEEWRKQNKHLQDYSTGDIQGALNRRLDFYRKKALDLVQKYDAIILEKFDLRSIAKLPEAEESKGLPDRARSNRQIASISEFRQCIETAAKRFNRRIILIDPANTSSICPDCGKRVKEPGDGSKMLLCRTPSCNGKIWDRDDLASRNIYRLGLEEDKREKQSDDKDEESHCLPKIPRLSAWKRLPKGLVLGTSASVVLSVVRNAVDTPSHGPRSWDVN